MKKEEFKQRWESDEHGGGITFNDIANCYVQWNLGSHPRTQPIGQVRYKVLVAAGVTDAQEYEPSGDD